jgi:glycosyltransferase involved in cell wall biosynthesis
LSELARQMPQVNFLWVGGTPELVKFWRGKLNEANITNVTMTGFVQHERIPLYQAASDVLLMPYSRSVEGSSGQDIAEVINPMKMFEYMAAGRPVISADLPSIREVLNEGNAVFCEPYGGRVGGGVSIQTSSTRPMQPYREVSEGGDHDVIDNWKSAIEALLEDEPRRLALGAQARKEVERFTWMNREEKVMSVLAQGSST